MTTRFFAIRVCPTRVVSEDSDIRRIKGDRLTIRSERRKVRAFALILTISPIPKTGFTILSSSVEFD